jgi:hypothetical protein
MGWERLFFVCRQSERARKYGVMPHHHRQGSHHSAPVRRSIARSCEVPCQNRERRRWFCRLIWNSIIAMGHSRLHLISVTDSETTTLSVFVSPPREHSCQNTALYCSFVRIPPCIVPLSEYRLVSFHGAAAGRTDKPTADVHQKKILPVVGEPWKNRDSSNKAPNIRWLILSLQLIMFSWVVSHQSWRSLFYH